MVKEQTKPEKASKLTSKNKAASVDVIFYKYFGF